MVGEVFKQYRYKGKTYTFYQSSDDETDVPIECSDGRKIYPYEKEIFEVVQKGEIILDNSNDIEDEI